MEKVSGSLAVLVEKSRKKAFHLGGNLKMQICWRKTFNFFHVCESSPPLSKISVSFKFSTISASLGRLAHLFEILIEIN